MKDNKSNIHIKGLQALSYAANKLIGSAAVQDEIADVLEQAGLAMAACRVRLMVAVSDPSDELLLEAVSHWISPECRQSYGDLAIAQISPKKLNLEHWQDAFVSGKSVIINLDTANKDELKFLEKFKVQSMMAIPIITHDRIWGVMGISNCDFLRLWKPEDIDFAFALGNIIASSIDRQELITISRQADRHFRSLIHNLPVGVLRVSARPLPIILMSNPAAADLLGYNSAESLVTVPVSTIFDQAAQWQHLYGKLISGQTDLQSECCCKKLTGEKIWLTICPTLVKSKTGSQDFIELVILDITRRIQAENALKTSEAEYKSLVESQSDLVLRLTLEGRIVFANNSASITLGKTRNELTQMIATAMVHPEDAPQVDRAIEDIARTRQKRTVEIRVMTITGWVWMEWEGCFVDGIAGSPDEVQAVGRDVTERVQAAETIKGERHLLRTIIDAIPSCLYMKDTHGRYVLANTEYIRQMGLKDESDIIGKTNASFQSPDRAEHCRKCDAEIMQTGIPVINRERYWTLADGRLCCHLFNSAAIRNKQGDVIGLIGIITDLSEQKRAEQAAKLTRQRYRDLMESIPVGVCRLKPNKLGEVIVANTAAANMFGLKHSDDMTGFCLRQIFDRPENEPDIFDNLMQSGYMPPVELKIIADKNTHWWGNFTARLVRDENDTPLHIDLVIEDISERRNAELSLQQAHNDIVNARETERRHLARELHDSLGQTIVAMHMNMQALAMAADRIGLDKNSFIQPLGQVTNRCESLVREVRHICQGLYPSALESLGLEAALQALARDHVSHCAISLDFDQDLADIRLSEAIEINLFRICQEAVSNAIKHGKASEIDIILQMCGKAITLSVSDNGNGFDPSIIRGGGIGLKGMQERASAIGADFEIITELAKGSEIRVKVTENTTEHQA